MKIMENREKNSSYKAHTAKIIIFLILTLALFTPLISAAEWDNKKSYDAEQKQITIYNWNIIGQIFNLKLAEYKLLKNTDYCLEDCFAEGTAVLYTDEQLFSDLSFRDNEGATEIKSSQIYTEQEIEYEIDVPDYKEICKIDEKNFSNVCTTEQTGTHKETRTKNEWAEYNGEVLTEGTYKWRIEGQKELRENIDWIGTAFGKDMIEWAWWSGDYSYCKNLEPSSTDTRISEVTDVNITNGTDWAYISFLYTGTAQNYSVYFNNITDIRIVNSSCNDVGTEANFQIIDSSHTTLYNVTLYEYFEFGYGHSDGDDITDNTDWAGSVPIDNFNDTASIRGDLSMYVDDQSGGVGLSLALTDSQKVLSFYYYDFGSANYEWFAMSDGGVVAGWIYRTATSATNMVYKEAAGYTDSGILRNATTFVPYKTIHNTTGTHFYYTNDTIITQTRVYAGGVQSPELIDWGIYIRQNHIDSIVVTTGLDVNQYPILTTFTLGAVQAIPAAIITLITPINYFNTSIQVDDFNLNITIPIGEDWTNYTFTIWDSGDTAIRERAVVNGTPDADCSETQYGQVIEVKCIGQAINTEGIYHWNTYGCLDSDLCNWAATNFTFTIDTTSPVVDIVIPTNTTYTTILAENNTAIVYLNWTASDTHLESCWYSTNNSVNMSVTCGTNQTLGLDYETYTITTCANDSANQITCSNVTATWNYVVNEGTATFNSTEYETALHQFQTNMTSNISILSLTAKLIYNGTPYTSDVNCDTSFNCNLTNAMDIPLGYKDQSGMNYSFYWSISATDGTTDYLINTTPNSQNVSRIHLQDCNTTYPTTGINYTAWLEQNLTKVDNWTYEGSYDFWLGSGSVFRNYSSSNVSTIEHNICIFPNRTFFTTAQIRYSKTGYITRDFYFCNESISNETQEVKLLLLSTSDATSFIVKVIDSDQLVVANAYVYVYRYDIGTGLFNLVEISLTDSSGATISHFVEDVVDYKIVIYLNGVAVFVGETQKIFCEETPCTIILQLTGEVNTEWLTFGDISDLTYTLTFDVATSIWNYTYVDESDSVERGRLYVYNMTGDTRTTICNVTSALTATTLLCDVSGQEGQIYAVAYIDDNPEILLSIKSAIIAGLKAIFGTEGLFLAMFVLLILGLAGLWNPAVGIILEIAGMIMLSMLGIASFGAVAIWGVIFIGGILLWELRT